MTQSLVGNVSALKTNAMFAPPASVGPRAYNELVCASETILVVSAISTRNEGMVKGEKGMQPPHSFNCASAEASTAAN
jgi:hypothetical protein